MEYGRAMFITGWTKLLYNLNKSKHNSFHMLWDILYILAILYST